jgi:hypothetical protein
MAKRRFRDRRGLLITTDIILAIVDAVLIVVVISGGFGAGFGDAGDRTVTQAASEQDAAEDEAAAAEQEPPSRPDEETDGDQAMEEDETAEPEPAREAPEPRPDERRPERVYTVTRGDTFFGLVARVWEDSHLWPDLYSLNQEDFRNPDLILPGQQVRVYPSLKADGRLSEVERSHLMAAYIETYRRYRSLGEEWLARAEDTGDAYLRRQGRGFIDKAQWLLYSGLRYSQTYLEQHGDTVDPRDLAVVESYVERFGYPEPR